jgi:hypothetical protein
VVFGTGAYFARSGQRTFYPEAAVTFLVEEAGGHTTCRWSSAPSPTPPTAAASPKHEALAPANPEV